jgi:hypothetical protein
MLASHFKALLAIQNKNFAEAYTNQAALTQYPFFFVSKSTQIFFVLFFGFPLDRVAARVS